MPRHRDHNARAGCAAWTAGAVSVAVLAATVTAVAVALATGPAEAAPAEPPQRARVCSHNGSGAMPCLRVGPSAPTWTPPAVPRG